MPYLKLLKSRNDNDNNNNNDDDDNNNNNNNNDSNNSHLPITYNKSFVYIIVKAVMSMRNWGKIPKSSTGLCTYFST